MLVLKPPSYTYKKCRINKHTAIRKSKFQLQQSPSLISEWITKEITQNNNKT